MTAIDCHISIYLFFEDIQSMFELEALQELLNKVYAK